MRVGWPRRTRALLPVPGSLFPLLTASLLHAQGMASEKGSVSQTIDGTTIVVEYYRPVARGRTPFPDVVHWGRFWTPGANWATTFDVDRPVHVNGNAVPKGRYSVWMVPGQDEWTVVLNRDAKRFHTQPPASSDEETRFTVSPRSGAHMETLAFYFPVVTRDGATLVMHWGTTVVPLRVTVEPSRVLTLDDRERATYVGAYRLTPSGSDTTVPETTIEVTESGGALHARATPALWGYDPTFDLVPTDHDGTFRPSFYHATKPFGMETDGQLEFSDTSGGHARTVELVSLGRVVARGARQN
jgi:hypothetical protein